MVLAVSFVLPGDRALLPPSSADMFLSKPGWAELNSASLDASIGASGPHDFAVRCNIPRPLAVDRSQAFRQPALQSHRAQNAAASTAPLPASVTIMIRPSCGVGWREFVEMICPTGEVKYFCKGDSTQKCPTGKSLEQIRRISSPQGLRAFSLRSWRTITWQAPLIARWRW